MHAAALSIFSVGARLWGEALPRQPANFPNRSAAASRKHWVEADDQDQWLYKTDSFIKLPRFCMADTGRAPRAERAPRRRRPVRFFGLLGPSPTNHAGQRQLMPLFQRMVFHRVLAATSSPVQKILFIKMLIRSTLFPINQIKWPQPFQLFLRQERLSGGFFFFLFLSYFFFSVAQIMMVFGVSLPSHKSQRQQINSSLQKKIHQGAIDFINCSGESLTGCLLQKCISGTKVEVMIWGNFFFLSLDVFF